MAASSKKKTFVNKDDLKRLMKEKKNTLITNKKKIESPLAKYDSLGQLHCGLCGCRVKTELLWNAHISGRTHKENVAQLKEQQSRKMEERLHPPNTTDMRKRKLPATETDGGNKLQKVTTQSASASSSQGSLPGDFFDNGPASSSSGGAGILGNLGGYDNSEGSDDNDPERSSAPDQKSTTAGSQVSGLPPDFFDSGIPSSKPTTDADETTEATPTSMAEKLPEGFFDDAKLDAKARQVEYKDKMEEEWEMFQKAMKEEHQVSEALQEEDNETVQVERNIKEIDEQMFHWSKVEELHQKKEQVMGAQRTAAGEETNECRSDSETEEQEYQEFLDWRSKKVH